MPKMVILLNRKESLSHEEFATHLREEHAPLAEKLPGLVRYSTSLPTDPDRSPYDGVAELSFEDGLAMKEAWDSEAGEAVKADSPEFMDVDANETLVLTEEVHVDG